MKLSLIMLWVLLISALSMARNYAMLTAKYVLYCGHAFLGLNSGIGSLMSDHVIRNSLTL